MPYWRSHKNNDSSDRSINNPNSCVPKLDLKNTEQEQNEDKTVKEETKQMENNNKEENNGVNEEQKQNAEKSPLEITSQQRKFHYIFKEYEAVAKSPIEGIYITPGADSPLVWYGLLIVRTGIFYGGIFRFTLTFSNYFPDTASMPIVQFEEPLFHPMVDSKTNCVDLNRHFPSGWQKDRNHIYQVIIATQGIFFSCHCDSTQAANPEAAILLKENRKKFIQMAHDVVRRSRTQVYAQPNSNDPNAIRFTPWNEAEMEPIRLHLLGKEEFQNRYSYNKNTNGFTWMCEERRRFLCDTQQTSIDGSMISGN